MKKGIAVSSNFLLLLFVGCTEDKKTKEQVAQNKRITQNVGKKNRKLKQK